MTLSILNSVSQFFRQIASVTRAAGLMLVMCLALPTWSAAPFTVNANGMVTDSTTKLVWDQCSYGMSDANCSTGPTFSGNWAAALTAATSANTANYKGFSDWRLPNKKELDSIVKFDGYAPGFPVIDGDAFPGTALAAFWTSTSHSQHPNQAWIVYFSDGAVKGQLKTDHYSVRLVRAGQPLAAFDILATAPDTPAAPTATAGNTTASVSFVAPADNDSPITGYNVQVATTAGGVYGDAAGGCAPATTNTSTATTCTATGLSNGTSYFFKVLAINGVGPSAYSPASSGTVPAGAPSTPAAPTASAGNTTASVSFAAPVNNGSPITGYNVQVATNAGGPYVDAAGGCAPATTNTSTATTCTATGLSNGTSYFFKVLAINGVGSSAYSPASSGTVPAGAPSTPAAPTASAGNAQASVSFLAPANNGSPITGYTVTSSPAGGIDGQAGTTAMTHTLTGLTNGTPYTFTVVATNGVGPSAASAPSNSVTPTAAPAPIPTLTGWSLAVLALLLGAMALRRVRVNGRAGP